MCNYFEINTFLVRIRILYTIMVDEQVAISFAVLFTRAMLENIMLGGGLPTQNKLRARFTPVHKVTAFSVNSSQNYFVY
jgi:hypothetical protein